MLRTLIKLNFSIFFMKTIEHSILFWKYIFVNLQGNNLDIAIISSFLLMLKCVCNVVKSIILKTYYKYFAICYDVHYNVSLLYIQFIPAFVILFWCAISDYNQIPGYVPITNAVPNWKKDMIIKKNEEKVREYVVNNWYSFIYMLETGINDSDCVPCMLILLWNLMKFPEVFYLESWIRTWIVGGA